MVLANPVVKDNNVSLFHDEISIAVEHWPSSIREEASADGDIRKDYLEQIFVNKKMAIEAKKITAKEDVEFYWKKEFAIRSVLINLYKERFKTTLKIPDMVTLAKEKFIANKEKYSAVAERRASSHILFICNTKECSREDKRKIANEVLIRLRKGESFEDLVAKYSEDPGTKSRKGSLGKLIALGEPHVIGEYTLGVFSITKTGEYSDIVESKFGFHIIRLDKIQEKTYLSFDKVKPKLIAYLQGEYEKLALAEFQKQFRYSKEVAFDDKALDAIFEKYKSKEIPDK
jgi:parvulin-like peptidyl-prolyl isomerase